MMPYKTVDVGIMIHEKLLNHDQLTVPYVLVVLIILKLSPNKEQLCR